MNFFHLFSNAKCRVKLCAMSIWALRVQKTTMLIALALAFDIWLTLYHSFYFCSFYFLVLSCIFAISLKYISRDICIVGKMLNCTVGGFKFEFGDANISPSRRYIACYSHFYRFNVSDNKVAYRIRIGIGISLQFFIHLSFISLSICTFQVPSFFWKLLTTKQQQWYFQLDWNVIKKCAKACFELHFCKLPATEHKL